MMCLVLPIQFTKKTTKTAQMDNVIKVKNFFGHWIKDIDIRWYLDDTKILPTNKSVDVYQYSTHQLKYLPNEAVFVVQKTFLYAKDPVWFTGSRDRRLATSTTAADRSDKNLDKQITLFKDWILKKNYYRIPLGFLVDLGLVNFAKKTDTKISCERKKHE